jgi:hypothetical protein
MRRQHIIAILTLITTLGAALRAHQLGLRLLWVDEARIYWIAQGNLAQLVAENATWNSAPPLFPLLIALVSRWADSEAGLRALSWVAGTLAIPAMYLLGRKFLSPPGALVGSLFLGAAVVQIKYSQEVREYSLSVLLVILLLTAFVHFLERPTWKRAAAVAALATVSLFMHYGLALIVLALNGVIAVHLWRAKAERKGLLVKWSAIQLLLLLVALGVIRLSLAEQWQEGGFWGAKGLYLERGYWDGAGLSSAVRFVYRGTRGLIEFAFPGLGFALVVYCGALVAVILRRHTLLPFLLGFPFPVFIAAALLRLYPYLGARQDLVLTPLIYLAAALGMDYLIQVDRKLIWVAVVLIQVLRLAWNPTAEYYRSGEKRDQGTVLRVLLDLARPGEPVYVCDADDVVIAYYFRVRFPQLPLTERNLGTEPRGYLDQIDGLVAAHPRTWLLLDHSCGEVESFVEHLASRWEVEPVEERSPILLYLVENPDLAAVLSRWRSSR